MTVTCIDNDVVNLTVGKQYEVHWWDGEWVYVFNDVGRITFYSRKHFA